MHKNLHITLYKSELKILWDEWMNFQCHINLPRKISDFSFFPPLTQTSNKRFPQGKYDLKLLSLQAESSLEGAGLLCSTDGYYFLSSYTHFKVVSHQVKPPCCLLPLWLVAGIPNYRSAPENTWCWTSCAFYIFSPKQWLQIGFNLKSYHLPGEAHSWKLTKLFKVSALLWGLCICMRKQVNLKNFFSPSL